MKKLAFALLLSGAAQAAELTAQQIQFLAPYSLKCEAMGIGIRSPQWNTCMETLIRADAQSQNNAINALGRSLQGAGATLNPQVYGQTYGAPPPVTTNCTTDYLGTHCTTTPY